MATVACGEDWIAKEIYRRELIKMKSTIHDKTEQQSIVMDWLETKFKELDSICK